MTLKMTPKEAYGTVKISITKLKSITYIMKSRDMKNSEIREQYNLCLHALTNMGQAAELLINNCNKLRNMILSCPSDSNGDNE